MKRYGLIGYPLGHSFSARYFADKFAREGIADCRYDLYELKTIEELPALLEAQPELRGFNVTIPRGVYSLFPVVSVMLLPTDPFPERT